MNAHKGYFIPIFMLCGATLARADAIDLQIGQGRGDYVPDQHQYAGKHQQDLFRGKKLQGTELDVTWHLSFRPISRFTSAWLIGLGHVASEVESSYPGGSLKLSRSTSYAHGGFRVQEERLAEPLILGAELLYFKGLAGKVRLRSPIGTERFTEDHDIFNLSAPALAATIGYKATSHIVLNAKVRFTKGIAPNILMGMSYDISHL
jgi:hypothetical protein